MAIILNFTKVSAQVYSLSTVDDAPVTDYWAGYFTVPDADLGTPLSTSDVWNNVGGFYLFLGTEVESWDIFTEKLNALRPKIGPSNELRALWIENPKEPASQWQMIPIMAQAGEFIMRRSAVQQIGVQNLANMNNGGSAGVTVNIQGNMIGNEEFVRGTLIPEINKSVRGNLA